MMYVTRREQFAASHRLHNPAWSDERNAAVFGKCNNPAGHGHNYVLEVTVAGDIDPDTGYVVDLKQLKDVIRERVMDTMDHKNLNVDVEALAGVIPTAENIARAIWRLLEPAIPGGRLYRIVLRETENNTVEYRGEE